MGSHHRPEKQRSGSAAAAVAGKTARACDSCLRRRARLYCAADDAFLCQGCDSSVHSANPLARRHHRLHLTTSSSLSAAAEPAWHHGIMRKARTPRPHHSSKSSSSPPPRLAVPELDTSSGDENSEEEAVAMAEEESQLLYRVPIFDPILAELFSPPQDRKPAECTPLAAAADPADAGSDGFAFLPSEKELAEFAVEMETLLGRDDAFSMEELGLADRCMPKVKAEEMGGGKNDDCGSPATAEGEVASDSTYNPGKRMSLTLDYDAVISEWSAVGGSPWTDGKRPRVGTDGCWPDYIMGMWAGSGGGGGGGEGGGLAGDGGREARVTRYREKRRTRLFSKKIRYEVRKLNAEKRPRMKGRFVKRAPFGGGAAAEPTFVC